MQYRRANIAGASFFITANLAERGARGTTSLTDHISILRDTLRQVKYSHPFHIDAMVVLPDHFHLLMTLPPGDAKFSTRIGAIKSMFSRQHPTTESIRASRESMRERGIWQKRFWEHLIRDDRDYANHVDYSRINLVKHGLLKRAVDWPHSTIHRLIERGTVDVKWAVDVGLDEAQLNLRARLGLQFPVRQCAKLRQAL